MRGALVGLVVVALLAIVGLGTSTDRRNRLSAPSDRSIPALVFDYALTMGIVAALLVAILAVALAPRPSRRGRRRSGPSLKTLLAIVLMTVLAAMAARLFLDRWEARSGDETGTRPPKSSRIRPEDRPVQRPDDYRFHFRWEVAALGGALVLLGLVAYARARRRRIDEGGVPESELAAELAVDLDEALDDLRSERDARRAVIAAYARMERTLAAHGVPRRSSETPLEYLSRVLRELRVRPAALLALTELFETAKFSRREIDLAMKEEAISAFESVRDDLRSTEVRPADASLVV